MELHSSALDARPHLFRLLLPGLLLGCGANHTGSGAEFVIFGTDEPPEEEAPCPLALPDQPTDEEGCPIQR